MNKLIKPVAMEIIRKGEHYFTNEHLINAAKRNLGYFDKENPFSIELNDIVAFQQIESSYWNRNAVKGKSCVVDAKEEKVTFVKLKLGNVF